MLELVTDYKEVCRNIATFNEELESSTSLINKLATFQHWYYSAELDAFGPSKFIGYKNNNEALYKKETNRENGQMDGRDTVKLLKRWFRPAQDSELETLWSRLIELLDAYDKKPNARANLHVLK